MDTVRELGRIPAGATVVSLHPLVYETAEGQRFTLRFLEKPLEAEMLLRAMTPEERMGVFMHFCRCCGSDDPRCMCWNDE